MKAKRQSTIKAIYISLSFDTLPHITLYLSKYILSYLLIQLIGLELDNDSLVFFDFILEIDYSDYIFMK